MRINIMFWIFCMFYWSAVVCMVWYILQFNWGDLTAIEVIEKCGIIGGIYYLSDLFRKEVVIGCTQTKQSGTKK